MQSPRELRAICQHGKHSDPSWYLIHRRLSIYVTWALLHTRITLDQVSLLMMGLGIAGAVLASRPSLAVNACGWLLLYGSFLLDKVDGEMARYRGQESVTGILLDRFHHRLVEPLLFLAVGVREFLLTGSTVAPLAALATMLAANIIEENQQLPAFIAFKYARELHRWPNRSRRPRSSHLERTAIMMKPLKAFRTFVTVLPLVAVACVLEALTGRRLTTGYLVVSAVSLWIYLVFQSYYYYASKLETDIAAFTQQLGMLPLPQHSPSPEAAPTIRRATHTPRTAEGTVPLTTIGEQLPSGGSSHEHVS